MQKFVQNVILYFRTIFCQFSTHQTLKTNHGLRADNDSSNLIIYKDDNEVSLFHHFCKSVGRKNSHNVKRRPKVF